MRVVAVLLATLILATPAYAGYTIIAQSVRAIQSWRGKDSGMGDGVLVLKNICTATSINSEKHYWLTAAHCTTDAELFVAYHRADVVFKDESADLAVLYTDGYFLPSLKMRTSPPTVEQLVTMVGHPVGLVQVQVVRGRISSVRTQIQDVSFMMFNMTACGGNSGSAVVDENNKVVSVLQIGYGEVCSPFSGGAPWETMVRLVYKYFKK